MIGLPPLPDGIALLAAINDGIRAAAAGYGAVLADVHRAFLGHGLTAGDITAADARPTNRNVWFCGPIEPNAWGAAAIEATWKAALRETTPPS